MKFAGLEIIRAAAALIVFLNHLVTHVNGFPRITPLLMLANFATEAVIAFFVLSGAVITISQEVTPRTAPEYLLARFIRIYPIYLIAIGAAVLAAGVTAEPSNIDAPTIAGNLAFLQTLPGFLVQTVSTNTPLWSLSYEVHFYVLFCMVIWRPQWRWAWLALSVLAGIAGYLHRFDSPLAGHVQSILQYSFYWLVGHFLAVYRRRITVNVPAGLAFMAAGIVLSRTFVGERFDYYDFVRLGGFALGCALLMAALLHEHPLLRARHAETVDGRNDWTDASKLVVAASLPLMWAISESHFATKISLSIAALTAALSPSRVTRYLLGVLKPMRGFFVFIGSISYAIYAVHFPAILIVDNLLGSAPWPVRAFAIVVTVIAIATLLERGMQPRIAASVGSLRDGLIRSPEIAKVKE